MMPHNVGMRRRVGPVRPHVAVRVRPVAAGDRPTVGWLVAELWGSPVQVVHGTAFRPAELPGFLAERSGKLAGLLTYHIAGCRLEIVTLNALERRRGVGTLLLDAAAGEARRHGCGTIRLTTTNDNVDALRFYQRRGFRLVALRAGAVDRGRFDKPEIPRFGDYGIPLRDEIDLDRDLLRVRITVATSATSPGIRGNRAPRADRWPDRMTA